jgi:hypothetical protein
MAPTPALSTDARGPVFRRLSLDPGPGRPRRKKYEKTLALYPKWGIPCTRSREYEPRTGGCDFRSTLTSSLVNSSRPSGRLFYRPIAVRPCDGPISLAVEGRSGAPSQPGRRRDDRPQKKQKSACVIPQMGNTLHSIPRVRTQDRGLRFPVHSDLLFSKLKPPFGAAFLSAQKHVAERKKVSFNFSLRKVQRNLF